MSGLCWLCDQPIQDPPEIVGRIIAGQSRVAHIECLRYAGEIELGLRAGDAGPGPHPREAPGRP